MIVTCLMKNHKKNDYLDWNIFDRLNYIIKPIFKLINNVLLKKKKKYPVKIRHFNNIQLTVL